MKDNSRWEFAELAERLLVMNGQKIIQHQMGGSGEWESKELVPKTSVKPGFYYLSSAQEANKRAASEGQIVHSDRKFLYQQCGTQLIKHDLSAFEKRPLDGAAAIIRYKKGQAVVEALSGVRRLKV